MKVILKPPARRKNRGQKDKFLAKFDSTNRTWLFSGLSDMFSQRFSGMMDKGLLCRDDPKILAFAMDPDVNLLDEPTSALDPIMVGGGPGGHPGPRSNGKNHDDRDPRDELRPGLNQNSFMTLLLFALGDM